MRAPPTRAAPPLAPPTRAVMVGTMAVRRRRCTTCTQAPRASCTVLARSKRRRRCRPCRPAHRRRAKVQGKGGEAAAMAMTMTG
eukprot:4085457-Prymnesium_polylepis.1